MKKEWDEQAWKNNVYPLYDDINSRLATQFKRAFGDKTYTSGLPTLALRDRAARLEDKPPAPRLMAPRRDR